MSFCEVTKLTLHSVTFQSFFSISRLLYFFSIAWFFILPNTLFSQNPEVFQEVSWYGLKDDQENVLIEAKYQNLGWFPDKGQSIENYLGYQQNGSWGLITIEGKKLTSAKYYSIVPFQKELFLVSSKSTLSNRLNYGLIDQKGNQVLSNSFFDLTDLEGYFLISDYNEGALRYGLFNDDYERVLPTEFLKIEKIDQVIAAQDSLERWRMFDLKGQSIVKEGLDHFEKTNNYIMISKNGARGLIDAEKSVLLYDTRYKNFTHLEDTPAAVEPEKWSIYDRSLNHIVDIDADSVTSNNELLISMLNEGQRFYSNNHEILKDKRLELKMERKGFVVAKSLDRVQAFDEKGKKIADGDSIYFDDTYFFIQTNEKWNILNSFGRRINEYPLDEVMVSQDNYIPVRRAGQWGLLDFSGKLIVPHVYDSIGVGFGAAFPVKYVGSWGIINAFGRWLVQPNYNSMKQISDLYVGEKRGVRTLLTRKGRNLHTTANELKLGNESIEIINEEGVGLITREGVVIFDPFYQYVKHLGDFYVGQRKEGSVIKDGLGSFVVRLDDGIEKVLDYSEGFFLIKKDGLFGFIDEKGRIRVANRYDSARHFCEAMAPIKLIGKWGFINKNESLVVQPQYLEVGDFKKSRAIVRKDLYGLVDQQGNEVLEVAFKNISRTEEGSYILEDREGRKGLANEKGEIILIPSFDAMVDIGSGLIIAERSGKKGIYDHSGTLLKGFDFKEIQPLKSYIIFLETEGFH